jgi:hypothetical protein
MAGDPTCRAAVMEYAQTALEAAIGPGLKAVKPKLADTDSLFSTNTTRAAYRGAQLPPEKSIVRGTINGDKRQSPSVDGPLDTAALSEAVKCHATTRAARSAVRHSDATAPSRPAQPSVNATAITVRAASSKGPRRKEGGNAEGDPVRPAHAALKALSQRVFNCLSCGKVSTGDHALCCP